MLRTIVWGTGSKFVQSLNLLKYYSCNQINIIGITGKGHRYDEIYGWKWINKLKIKEYNVEAIIVMAGEEIFYEILEEIKSLEISDKIVIPYQILQIPGVLLSNYIELKKNTPSIISMNCWGGLTYHYLGLRFESPFINLFLTENDFIKLIREPLRYLSFQLELDHMSFNPELNIEYPVCWLVDVKIYFNHYRSLSEAVDSWEKRKHRVNPDNLFTSMYTDNVEVSKEFSRVINKGICFTSFKPENDEKCMDISSMKQGGR